MASFTFFSSPNSIKIKTETSVVSKIESYLSSVYTSNKAATVTVFSDFLIKENRDIYSIDFMLTDKGELIILTKEIEQEYYKMETFSAQNLKQQTFSVATIAPHVHKA